MFLFFNVPGWPKVHWFEPAAPLPYYARCVRPIPPLIVKHIAFRQADIICSNELIMYGGRARNCEASIHKKPLK